MLLLCQLLIHAKKKLANRRCIKSKGYIDHLTEFASEIAAAAHANITDDSIHMKSFLDFIQLSLFYIDPIVQSDRRVRASTSKPGRKGPITERNTLCLLYTSPSPRD